MRIIFMPPPVEPELAPTQDSSRKASGTKIGQVL